MLIVLCSWYSVAFEVKAPSDLSSRSREAVEVTRDKVRTDRRDLVAKSMNLTDDEAQAFWPVYDQYVQELSKVSGRTVTLSTQFADNYKDLADREALRMTSESLGIEQQRLAVQQQCAQRFASVPPGK
jgi:hypothetical protein